MRNSVTLCFQLNVLTTSNNDQVLPDVMNRLSLYIKNTGANPCLLGFGSDAGNGLTIAAGESLKWDNPEGCPNCFVQVSQIGGLVSELTVISVNEKG